MAAVKPLKQNAGAIESFVDSTDFLAVTQGGTGAVTASGARTALGLAIGTDVVAWDADLDAVAALSSTGIAVRTAANTWAIRSLAAPAAGFTITDTAGVAGNPTFVLANDLGALEGLSSTGIAVRTASDTWAQRTITGTASNIGVTNGDGVAGNPTIDLVTVTQGATGTSFVKIQLDTKGRVINNTAVVTADITALVGGTYAPINNPTFTGTVTLAADPVSALQAATKQYVDGIASGMDWKASVRVATTTNGTLATAFQNAAVVDGVTLATGDRILLKDQSTAADNGVYVVAASGAPTRATDADASVEVTGGLSVWVNEGTTNADTAWTLTTNDPITLGSTALTFTQTSGLGQITAGGGLTKTGNTLDVATAAATRIAINADSIDLGQPSIGGSGAAAGITKVTVDVYGRVTNTGTAAPSDIGAQSVDADLTAIAAITGTGSLTRTAADTWAVRTLQAPAAGFTITNPAGVAGDPTFVLANDLSALEALSTSGFPARTGTDTYAIRSLATASSSRITVTNPAGTAGDPTVDLASGVIASPGTYGSVTVDTYGRVTAGSASAAVGNILVSLNNQEAGSIVIGQAVYVFGSGQVKKANANAAGTKDAVGLVNDASIATTVSGNIAVSGVVTATTVQWDAVTGQSGGLTFGAIYYLDATTAGKITSTAPASGWVLKIGIALSTTQLSLQIGQSIKL